MSKLSRNFIAGRMNKVVDERLLPDGEYIDAMNIRMGSTEQSEIGVIENTKGNLPLTQLAPINSSQLSTQARTIGAIQDSANNLIYWFVHDPAYIESGQTGICDLIVSYNILTQILVYHVVSIWDAVINDGTTILNFNPDYLITGVNIIEDLLFFTDDYNQPRVINVKRNYLKPLTNNSPDPFTNEELMVIKKPPIQSPTVEPFAASGQENYLDTRFISFAYRYRYIDGEYSATSQWSDVSFIPKSFEFAVSSMLNEGMTNSCNSAKVTYNSGSPLVVGVDLLFKQSANNIIKIIEKIDKNNVGLSDNTDYTFVFDSSKIFTILPESELLRLYDNVPLKAKAQTIMGNRLMYGNYVEGYDLIDSNGNNLKLEYSAKLITNDIELYSLTDSQEIGNYSIDGSQSIADAVTYVDFNGITLNEGAALTMLVSFEHAAFSGGTLPAQTQLITFEFIFILPNSYTSVYQMATSSEFQAAIGTSLPIGNIKPVYSPVPGSPTSCDGITLTDEFNCSIPASLGTLLKDASGITAAGQAIGILTTPSSTEIGFQLPAMKFVDNHTAPTNTVYEYYQITSTIATFQDIASPKSLHSNRDYEIGIVYMDEFNRASTALVSPYNTVHVPCGYSASQNSIQVTIPPTQIAPYWAKRYKFVIKPSAEYYETIYSQIYFKDPDTNETWFYLEGENIRKVETGDRLIVKADTSGPTQSCAYATVLEKAVKTANFIIPTSGIAVLGGTYMKINPSEFSVVEDPNSYVNLGIGETYAPPGPFSGPGNYAVLPYPVNIFKGAGFDTLNPLWEYEDFTVPAGSKVVVKFKWNRAGKPGGGYCDHKGYVLEKTYTVSNNYDNFQDWFTGDNINLTLNSGTSIDGTSLSFISSVGVLSTFSNSVNYLQFDYDPVTNKRILQFGTGESCLGSIINQKNWMRYYVTVLITVFRANGQLIFETEATDALPDVFFENNLSFEITNNSGNLNHAGNVQNQDIATSTPAIVDTGFFNCFTFGNGVESYKVRDSIIGRYFTLGERVNTVSEQSYKMSDRFADITYSGIYNAETNVNKLNEFNLGLFDYKKLEASFGDIYILDGRQTDVLVLQEDKISYVLAGKNLLSDSAAGGAITSVPEVLGTQIARVEKYGISFNPESYVHWGYNRYFTDTKRGVVINIIGDSMQQDALSVVSDIGMRTWFRDEFNKSYNTQKLGGYDPYMNEYVLSTNNIKIPTQNENIPCGTTQVFSFDTPDQANTIYYFIVDLGQYVGDVTININNFVGTSFQLFAVYASGVAVNTSISGNTSATFTKGYVADNLVYIQLIYSAAFSCEFIVNCPDAALINVVQVVLANNADVGDTTHVQYRYIDGVYTSPLQSTPITLLSGTTPPVVSFYNIISGYEGASNMPPSGSTVRIQSSQITPDTFVFNPTNDKFRYLRSSTLYPNTTTGINSLIVAASLATPISGSGTTWYADAVISGAGNYIYLIWDFRDAVPVNLCYTDSETISPQKEVCCNCLSCGDREDCLTVNVYNPSLEDTAIVNFPNGDNNCGGESSSFEISVNQEEGETLCINNVTTGVPLWVIIQGNPIVTVTNCGCGVPPSNTVPPLLSYTTLYPGDVITTSDGTWI